MTNKLDVNTFIEETKINPVNLDDAFMKQSSLRAYYGAMAANADMNAAKAKARFDILEARLYKKYRDAATTEGVKTTEKSLENQVKLDEEWAKGKAEYINAQCYADVAKALVSSLVDRRDMLIQLGADRRDESKGQMRVMAAQAEADRMDRLRDTAKSLYPYQ